MKRRHRVLARLRLYAAPQIAVDQTLLNTKRPDGPKPRWLELERERIEQYNRDRLLSPGESDPRD